MGRGRVEMKRIDNKVKRQVTFAKRRNGLLKKACELSILCDAEVALIMFSNRGKLFEFSSNTSSMSKTLEKYKKWSYGTMDHGEPVNGNENSYHEYLKLKARFEIMQRCQRNFFGEDLGTLTTKELDHLEHQMEASLSQIRYTKTQVMLAQLADLQKREKLLAESNKALRRKVEPAAQGLCRNFKLRNRKNQAILLLRQLEEYNIGVPFRNPWETQLQNLDPYNHIWTYSEGLFQPFSLLSPLQIGLNRADNDDMNVEPPSNNVNGFSPGWML